MPLIRCLLATKANTGKTNTYQSKRGWLRDAALFSVSVDKVIRSGDDDVVTEADAVWHTWTFIRNHRSFLLRCPRR